MACGPTRPWLSDDLGCGMRPNWLQYAAKGTHLQSGRLEMG